MGQALAGGPKSHIGGDQKTDQSLAQPIEKSGTPSPETPPGISDGFGTGSYHLEEVRCKRVTLPAGAHRSKHLFLLTCICIFYPTHDTIHEANKRRIKRCPPCLPLLSSMPFRLCSANRAWGPLCPRFRQRSIHPLRPVLPSWTTCWAAGFHAGRSPSWWEKLLRAARAWCCRYWRKRPHARK